MDRSVADNGSQLPLDLHGPDGESAFDIFVSPPLSPVSRSQHSLRDGGDDHLVSTRPEPYTSVCQPPNIDTASRPATLWPSQHPGKASTTRRSRGSTLSVSFADASASGHGTSQRGRQDGHSPRLTATEQFPQLPLASIAVASSKEEVTNTNESLATVFHSLPAHGRKYSRSMDGQGGIDRDTRSRGSLESTSSSIGSSSDDVTPVAPPTPGNGPLPTVSSPNGPSHTLSRIIQQRVTSHFIGSRLSISRMKKNRMTLMLQFVDPVQEDKYLQFAARINQSPVRFFTSVFASAATRCRSLSVCIQAQNGRVCWIHECLHVAQVGRHHVCWSLLGPFAKFTTFEPA
ncbi:hypothetical protein BCR44DRAFT_350992 [Catenaria anguillulae PL171]|uniref:Uncharacterized protein n=1 Tax=Catenaria anguillulae PL171 TaxID=765915 RepID=A0A1Y2H939_9FUNG|nr:hypothetical protein BCR44DRAFT_350992 [Catenaria anguillulae PL171]